MEAGNRVQFIAKPQHYLSKLNVGEVVEIENTRTDDCGNTSLYIDGIGWITDRYFREVDNLED
jgi:hypothetical protein